METLAELVARWAAPCILAWPKRIFGDKIEPIEDEE